MTSVGKSQFSLRDCKAALQEILATFDLPENAARLEEAKTAAGNDMLRSMQTVFPAAAQMQMGVIQGYGFLPDGEGLVQFTKAVRVYEDQDQEVRQLNTRLRTFLIPPVNVPHPVAPLNINNHNGSSQ
ncbi:protein c10-like [Plakobranchus ocellatus]|uniref:Protein C10 n=1 Tax=Plakobranchus ocellatus TaxID=259542 RepID=A0AAV3YJZ6_9GAST|nr:protein c10-like [Plakobranchus ocellatus]